MNAIAEISNGCAAGTECPALPTLSPQLSTISLPGMIQPVENVRAYLETRRPQPDWEAEQPLWITLPTLVRNEVKALKSAFGQVERLIRDRVKVEPACRVVICIYKDRHWHLKTFRARFDLWRKTNDWVVLVNRSKAGALWQVRKEGLSDEFIKFCAARFAQFKRSDGKRQALASIKRQWKTGRNDMGEAEAIPGYGFWRDWFIKMHGAHGVTRPTLPLEAPVPEGWSYSNILRQIKDRGVFTRAVQALAHEGTAPARDFLPGTLGTREGLRFMEEVQFDDVKTDWRVIDPASGQVNDLWLLVARDRATTVLLGFGMRPARARDDGTQEHLKLQDMKQLCGWLLERYGLPPYEMKWKIERGTATLSEGSAAALQEMLPGRIRVSFSSMLGGKSGAGYFERRIGNSKGKATLEVHNRLMHTIGANLPAQTGPAYEVRPADLAAREKETALIWNLASQLPENLQSEVGFPMLTIDQARKHLFRIFGIQNHRTEHEIEGFETMVEWFNPVQGKWLPQNTAPNPLPEGSQIRARKESPVERAAHLVAGLEWTRVSPEIITAFYEHTQWPVRVGEDGEITSRGKTYLNPTGMKLPAGTRLLAYLHPDDPVFMHLTDGNGVIVGTWILRNRAADQDAISQAIKYSAHALKEARAQADELGADERQRLAAMRERNCEIMKGFVEVTPAEMQRGKLVAQGHQSPVASGLAAVGELKMQKEKLKREEGARAADAILASGENTEHRTSNIEHRIEDTSAGDDLLNALAGK